MHPGGVGWCFGWANRGTKVEKYGTETRSARTPKKGISMKVWALPELKN